MVDEQTLIEQLCRYSRLCYDRGLVGATGGNLSVRSPDGLIIITPSSIALRDIAPDCLIKVDSRGNKVSGPENLRPSKESPLHLNILASRPQAGAVIHVHPPYATALSVMSRTVNPITASAEVKLVRPIPIVPYALPGSAELAEGTRRTVLDHPHTEGVVLERHGLITFAQDLEGAFNLAELVEETAKIQWLCGGG